MTKLLQDILLEPARLKRCLASLTNGTRPAVEEAAALIRRAGAVQVVGIGSSWNAGMMVAAAFQRAGLSSSLAEASELLHFGPWPNPGPTLVLSRSGRSVEIVRLLERLRESRSPVIAVTNTPESPLGREADVVVPLEAPFDHLVSVVMYSGLMLGGGVIAAQCGGSLSQELVDALAAALDEAQGALDGWRDGLEASGWLTADAPTYFLARGPSLATAHEARLLWEEAAKMPATALSTGGFRHGSQEVLSRSTRVALWIDPGTQRAADLRLAADLRAAGAKLLLIDSSGAPGSADWAVSIPHVPAGWHPLLDVIPAQLAAERLAALRQQDCDAFRYCSYVVEHEEGLHPATGTAAPLPPPPQPDRLSRLATSRRPGHSLDQAFYVDQEIFDADVDRIFMRHWLFAGHVDRVSKTGDYFLFEFAGESLIIVRGTDDVVRAFYNVCRHRGSRICRDPSGQVRSLVCPYHRWTYRLDGGLAAAKHMPLTFDPGTVHLQPAHLRIVEGLIFVSFASSPPSLEAVERDVLPHLRPHELASARICHTARYEIRANWKLVVENSRECYHCPQAHPEYCRIMGFAAAVDSPRLAEEDEAVTRECMAHWHAMGLETVAVEFTDATRHHAIRMPFRRGCVSQSVDGQPVAPVMGALPQRDVGALAVVIYPTFWFEASSDYAMTQRFLPVAPDLTAVEMTWLVRADAREGVDFDVDRVTAFWKATAEQDRLICEDNQVGVRSRAYRPGPYSAIEGEVEKFVRWYLNELTTQPADAPVGLAAPRSASRGLEEGVECDAEDGAGAAPAGSA